MCGPFIQISIKVDYFLDMKKHCKCKIRSFIIQHTLYIHLQSQFDLASLTKVLATTTACMILYQKGHLDLGKLSAV